MPSAASSELPSLLQVAAYVSEAAQWLDENAPGWEHVVVERGLGQKYGYEGFQLSCYFNSAQLAIIKDKLLRGYRPEHHGRRIQRIHSMIIGVRFDAPAVGLHPGPAMDVVTRTMIIDMTIRCWCTEALTRLDGQRD